MASAQDRAQRLVDELQDAAAARDLALLEQTLETAKAVEVRPSESAKATAGAALAFGMNFHIECGVSNAKCETD